MDSDYSISPYPDERDTSMPIVNVQLAGAQLRKWRDGFMITPNLRSLVRDNRDYGLTIDEVAVLSRGTLSKAAISKLERGEVQHPSMDSLVALGAIYQRTPNDMAVLYGYWEPVVETSFDDSRVTKFLRQVEYYRVRDPMKSEVLLASLESAVRMVESLPD